jgi:uncharacterized repeat protein (TIGR03943 family)
MTPHLARGVLLLGLAGLIAKLQWTGQMALYLSPAFDPLNLIAAFVLAGMGGFELWTAARRAAGAREHQSPTDATLSYLMFLLPIGLGLSIAPRALDSAALGGQDVTSLVVAFSPTPASGPVGPPLHPIQDVADLFKYLREAGESGVGQPVHLVGIVARSANQPADQFVLLRYSIVHCVADAQPLGLLVHLPPGQSATSDAWVEIDGALSSSPQGGSSLITVVATRVTPTNEPPYPYLQSL